MRQAAPSRFASVIAVVGLVSASLSTAQQSQKAKSAQFEVAAIRPSNPTLGAYGSSSTGLSGSEYRITNTPLNQWIEIGLSVRGDALKAPSWLDTSRFDLDAKLPAGGPVNQRVISGMMKALLIERFGLVWHEEVVSVSGYELVTGKKVLAKPSSPSERLKDEDGFSSGPAFIGGTNISMQELAGALETVLGKAVADATHLSGGFDVRLFWSPSDAATLANEMRYGRQYGIDVENLPSSVFTALQEQLGLRLRSATVSSKVIVVDHMNRLPTEN